MLTLNKHLIRHYVTEMPTQIREYLLTQRGLTAPIIWLHQLGWNGHRITMPIFDRRGQLVFFKLARSPDDAPESPKILWWPAGPEAASYGRESRKEAPTQPVACEG